MEKRAHIFSWMGSVFVVCILFAAVFASGKQAEAALGVKEINYKNSTITITTDDPGDTTLYFSDKRKTKWEMAPEQFQNKECTMDISWVSMTQNYELTFKGDKTNKSEDILSVIIPKQEKGFKAKYNLSSKEVTFTGAEGRDIEYRKNNTENWSLFTTSEALKPVLERLSENGASVYFRLQAEPGTSASAGHRPSKEVACKISKKTAAPNVTINTDDSTIAVQSGWQVRKVTITEKSGVQYASSLGNWTTYASAKDVPLEEMASEAVYKAGEDQSVEKKDVYLQFRKSATSTAQMSYITTIKVPAQEAAPTAENSGISIEYTSPTSFKLTISAASPTRQYEYCIVDEQDFDANKNKITDMESVTWKTISSATATELKEADAPEGSVIFYRKKAVGKTGDDNFKLATPYTKYSDAIKYPASASSGMNVDKYVFDGVCVTGNSSGSMTFTYNSPFNSKITSIGLSTTPAPTAKGDSTVTFTSSVAANSKPTGTNGEDKYIVTMTITNISLSSDIKSALETAGTSGKTLYAYITLSSGEPISSTDDTGLRIHMMKKSTIETNAENTDSTLNVTRFVGSTTKVGSNSQYESFEFTLTPGYTYGSIPFSTTGENNNPAEMSKMIISSVQLGNYSLTSNTDYADYKYDPETKIFTVYLSKFETNAALVPYYGTTQNLVINLSNGEKLTGVSVKLAAPVSLNDTYAWAFTRGQLVTEKTTTTTDTSGKTTTTTEPVNSYSVGYQKSSAVSNGISIESCTFQSATLGTDTTGSAINILSSTEEGNKIVFSNKLLNEKGSTGDVQITFHITYSNGATQDYTITKGCRFTIL